MSSEGTKRPPFPKWITRPQMLVALSALLLSVCGLFISIYEASLVRRAQRASVWPHVEVAVSNSEEGLKLWVHNTGVGPARIRAGEVTYQGETLAGWSDLIRRVAGEEAGGANFNWSLINGRVLAPTSERETIFAVTAGDGADVIVPLRRAIFGGEVDIRICYCSVYEECWTSSLRGVSEASRGAETAGGSRGVDGCDSARRSGI